MKTIQAVHQRPTAARTFQQVQRIARIAFQRANTLKQQAEHERAEQLRKMAHALDDIARAEVQAIFPDAPDDITVEFKE